MDYLKKNFIYLSQIINLPVVNFSNNKKIGYVVDVVSVLREMYPKATALIIRKKFSRKKLYLSWDKITKLIEDKIIFVDNLKEVFFDEINLSENEILLKQTFYDKQIVDISGAKLVRVNDLHLLRENSNLWLVHVDIGFKGILRRLGYLNFFNFISRWLFLYELKDKFIGWKYVQPITTSGKPSSISLKIPYAKLSELHPADLADILIDLGPDERMIIFKSLDNLTSAKVLQEIPLKIRVQIAESLNPLHLANILQEMPMDEVVDLLAELPKKVINSLFNILPQEKVVQIKDLLEHSEHIAGSLMNTEFITVKHNTTAGEVLNKIK